LFYICDCIYNINRKMEATLEFFRGLKANNDRAWFDAHRKEYESSKKRFEQFCQNLISGLESVDSGVVASRLQAKDCTFRIFRDVRFSKNKDPYKTNYFGYFARDGRKSIYAGYYFCVEPEGESFFGGGIYMPEPPQLAKVRQEIAYCTEEFKTIIQAPAFLQTFPDGLKTTERLSRPPQGYEATHPAIEYLKQKSFFTSKPLSDAEVCAADLQEKILAGFQTVAPLVHFINRALEPIED